MKFTTAAIMLIISAIAYGQTPVVSGGRLERIVNFPSIHIQPRNVDIWLPSNYSSSKKYAVLYMHDGQMLFDSSSTWNHQEWKADETMAEGITLQKFQDCIIVAPWNNGAYRHSEYFPQKPISYMRAGFRDTLIQRDLKGNPQADKYLLFLVKELKPYIDSHFSTYADRAHTFVSGSSMGGLISLYAICEYPTVFGGAACLSTHWPGTLPVGKGECPAAFLKYMSTHLPNPKNHKIYFDYGSTTLDSLYKPYQLKADAIMKQKGYGPANWVTREFIGQDHSETAWSSRLHIPFYFLLKK